MSGAVRRAGYSFAFVLTLFTHAAPQVSVEPRTTSPPRARSFLDYALDLTRAYVAATTTLVANANLLQRVPGLTHVVKSDVRILYRSPDFLLMEVKNPYPYTTLVSNHVVQVWIPASNDYEARPLAPGETIWEDFLGVGVFLNEGDWDFSFRTEGDLYILSAALRPSVRAALATNELMYAHRAVRRTLWIDPRRKLVVRTQRVTLVGEEATLEFRDQWRNMGLLQP